MCFKDADNAASLRQDLIDWSHDLPAVAAPALMLLLPLLAEWSEAECPGSDGFGPFA
jgi:hypothetical protein